MEVNDKAPEFSLANEDGVTVSSKDLKGKNLVLFFYPKANTPGWTLEACGFRDAFKQIIKAGATVYGVSPDKPSAQKKFKEKYELPYSLLADVDKELAKKFDVLKEKSMYGKKYMGIERTTFVIHPDGKIAAILTGIKPEEHAKAVLAALKSAWELRQQQIKILPLINADKRGSESKPTTKNLAELALCVPSCPLWLSFLYWA
jgi:peroxiredoxin Q/BCP